MRVSGISASFSPPTKLSRSNILADRLVKLVDAGVLTRADDPAHKLKAIYSLTEMGIELLADHCRDQPLEPEVPAGRSANGARTGEARDRAGPNAAPSSWKPPREWHLRPAALPHVAAERPEPGALSLLPLMGGKQLVSVSELAQPHEAVPPIRCRPCPELPRP